MKSVAKLALSEFILEEKGENRLHAIERAFNEGNKRKLLRKIRSAKRLVRARETRVTKRLINEAKKKKLVVHGENIDIFAKELLAKHKSLYDKLGEMTKENQPVGLEVLEKLISEVLKIEEELIQNIRGLIIELRKEG